MKRYSTSLIIKETQFKTTVEYYFVHIRTPLSKRGKRELKRKKLEERERRRIEEEKGGGEKRGGRKGRKDRDMEKSKSVYY